MSFRTWQTGVTVLVGLLGAACTTMGTGVSETRGDRQSVSFDWESKNAVTAEITATLADGKRYTGSLFQIASDTRVEEVAPLWDGWHGWWARGGAWDYWDADPDFITHYTGRVVANLSDMQGDHMRCNFRLVHSAKGMTGGGTGECQLFDGQTIDANFPAA